MAHSEMVQSILRGLDILEAVAASDRGLTTMQLSQELGWKHSTTANLIRTLESRGYLHRQTTRAPLRLGAAVHRLVSAEDHNSFLQRASDALRQLARLWPAIDFGLAQRVGDQVCGMLHLDSRSGQLTRLRDMSLNPYTSLHALVFLAFGTDDLRQQTYRRYNLHDYAAPVWTAIEDLEQWLDASRRQGYLVMPKDTQGRFRIACPVYDARKTLTASLGAWTYQPLTADEQHQLIRQMLDAARDLATPDPSAPPDGCS